MNASIRIPTPVRAALEDGAALAISMSGGKDSLAMATALVKAVDRHGWPGEVYAVHADLGRMDWGGYEDEDHWLSTLGHVRSQAERLGLPLVVVRRMTTGTRAGSSPFPWNSFIHPEVRWGIRDHVLA